MKKILLLFFTVNRENRMWSFTIIGLIALSLTMQSFISATQEDGDGELSPLVGCWNYIWNDDVHQFYIWCGERNDSLLIAVNGVFNNGAKIQGYDFDNDGTTIPHVRILKSEDKIVKGKISDVCLMFYSLPVNPGYKEFVLELIDSNTLLWKFEGGRCFLQEIDEKL